MCFFLGTVKIHREFTLCFFCEFIAYRVIRAPNDYVSALLNSYTYSEFIDELGVGCNISVKNPKGYENDCDNFGNLNDVPLVLRVIFAELLLLLLLV